MRRIIGAMTLAGSFIAPATFGAELFMREGFENRDPHTWTLRPCERDENRFSADGLSISGASSARLEVRPREIRLALAKLKACRDWTDPDAGYEKDGSERAELRTPEDRYLDLSTDAWYGFSMLIDGEVREDGKRLVIGQWKQGGDRSPIVALRFKNRVFHITVEQDGSGAPDCRILVAYQQGKPQPVADSEEHPRALKHDLEARGGKTGCASDIALTVPGGAARPPASLPDPFRRCWIDMIVHLKGSSATDGVFELWANGTKIVRVDGRIGFRGKDRQLYFKFGPYRNGGEADYVTVAHLDSFTRGRSLVEVDPARFPARKAETCQPARAR